ncbi:unnamed protein product [Meloidogyne enterolobii]|uniref:Uncharacterized protein n=1 Tax=Meloidogyne enterolobii TaxID=390850 RepID=A0ACB0Z3Y0_MELEN
MRLWRLLIYFTLLNVYFICVETLKGSREYLFLEFFEILVDGKFEKQKIDEVKPKELKLEAETKRMTFRCSVNTVIVKSVIFFGLLLGKKSDNLSCQNIKIKILTLQD